MAEELMSWSGNRWVKKITTADVPVEYRKQHWVSPRQLKKRYPDLVSKPTRDGTRKAANQYWHDLQAEIRTKIVADDPNLAQLVRIRKQRRFTPREKQLYHKLFNERMATAREAISKVHFDEEPTRLQLKVIESVIVASLNDELPLSPVETANDVSHWREKWLALRKQALKPSSYNSLRFHLPKFVDHVGDHSDVTKINEETVESFRASVAQKVENEDFSSVYADNISTTIKAFLEYLYQMRKIERPRNLDSLSFSIPTREPNPLALDVAKRLIHESSGLLHCWILLLFNCAYIQSDLNELKPTEVDWKHGRIIRKRTKEANEKRVPKVNYRLWSKTFEELKQFGLDKGDRVFLNEGKPLIKDRNDLVARHFKTFVESVGIEATVKQIRKTVATQLAAEKLYIPYLHCYCGWAPSSIQDKHYLVPPPNVLDEMSEHLAKKFEVRY